MISDEYDPTGDCAQYHSVCLFSFQHRALFCKPVFTAILLVLAVCVPGMVRATGIIQSGETPGGAITTTGQIDSWTFSASAGQAIVVRVGNASTTNTSFAPKIALINPISGVQSTATGGAAAEIAVTATNTGTFTVQVSDNAGTHTGPYILSLALSGEAVTVSPGFQGGPMTNGFMHTGTIIQGGLEEWTIDATVGEAIVVRVGEMTATNSFTPTIRLYDPSGTRLGSSGGAFAAEIAVRATNSGIFLVVVGDGNGALSGSGNYRLTFADNADPVMITPGQEGGPMTNGSVEMGTVPTGGLQLWTFTASSGEALIVRMGQITSTNTFTPWVRLYDPSGTLLGTSASSPTAEITTRATNSGTFLVVVGDGNGALSGSGDYRLTLADNVDPVVITPGNDGGPMTNGWVHMGTIQTGGLELWTFSATPGEAIVVRAGAITSTNSFTPWVRLYDPSGTLLGTTASSPTAEVATRATNSGTFLVVVGDGNGALSGSGTYRLTLADNVDPVVITPGSDGGPMTNAWVHMGTIQIGGLELWTFSATPGEAIVVRAGAITSTNSFTPWVRLYDPSGTLLGNTAGSPTAEVTTRATNSGTFLVVVGDGNGNRSGSGVYRLTLADNVDPVVITPGSDGGPMTNAWVHMGTTQIGGLELWSFSATPGEAIVVRAGAITSTNSFTPWVRLYDPSGALLGSVAGSPTAEVTTTATNTGRFLVVVGDDNGNQSGSGIYRLTLVDNVDPVVITPGSDGGPMTNGWVHTGTIQTGGLETWTFNATPGEAIVLRAGQITSTNTFSPWVRLYDPSGTLLGSVAGDPTAEVTTRATNTGRFLVVVGDGNGNRSGSGVYRLTLADNVDPVVITPGSDGGPMTNAWMHMGTTQTGGLELWTFSATPGEAIVVRAGQITSTNTFSPWVRLYDPSGVLLGSVAGDPTAEVSTRATNAGTFLVVVGDGNGNRSGSGVYRLTLADNLDPVVITPGDEGGPMTNGMIQTGFIPTGDLDLWTFSAQKNQAIVLRVGVITATNSFTPGIRLYDPSGALLGFTAGASAAEVSTRATNSGTFLVVVGDNNGALSGTGDYQLVLAKTDAGVVTSFGDSGGPLVNGVNPQGTINQGDLDVYIFSACEGEPVSLTVNKLTDTSGNFTPWLRLYGPDGGLLGNMANATTDQINLITTNRGSFIVLVGDGDGSLSGTGTYELSTDGLSYENRMCDPILFGTNVNLTAVGGPTNGTYVLLQATNVTTPLSDWTPILTNQFDQFGVFSVSNFVDYSVPRKFYTFSIP